MTVIPGEKIDHRDPSDVDIPVVPEVSRDRSDVNVPEHRDPRDHRDIPL